MTHSSPMTNARAAARVATLALLVLAAAPVAANAASIFSSPFRAGQTLVFGNTPEHCENRDYFCEMAKVHCTGSYLGVSDRCIHYREKCREFTRLCPY